MLLSYAVMHAHRRRYGRNRLNVEGMMSALVRRNCSKQSARERAENDCATLLEYHRSSLLHICGIWGLCAVAVGDRLIHRFREASEQNMCTAGHLGDR